MTEEYQKIQGTKEEQYLHLLEQAEVLVAHETNFIANLANIAALIKTQFEWHWVGFYLVDSSAQNLVLGPFQGPLACTRIPFGKGVCGTAYQTAATQIVADVHHFPGHIACSSLSNSEIVVPLLKNNKVIGVLDIDSVCFASFDATDAAYLEKLCVIIMQSVPNL